MVHIFYLFSKDVRAGEGVGDQQLDVAWTVTDPISQVEDSHICVVMVGLPARGKSLIAQKSEFINFQLATSKLIKLFV
jgi:hypothetical protein